MLTPTPPPPHKKNKTTKTISVTQQFIIPLKLHWTETGHSRRNTLVWRVSKLHILVETEFKYSNLLFEKTNRWRCCVLCVSSDNPGAVDFGLMSGVYVSRTEDSSDPWSSTAAVGIWVTVVWSFTSDPWCTYKYIYIFPLYTVHINKKYHWDTRWKTYGNSQILFNINHQV